MAAIDHAPTLRVLGDFELLIAGERTFITTNARRLLAFLAISPCSHRRETVAGQLWERVSQPHARAALRTALWRVRQLPADLISTCHDEIRLEHDVHLDLTDSTARARDLFILDLHGAVLDTPEPFIEDILPGWDEDWLQLERERHRQLRIHALEALSGRLTSAGRYASAIDVAYRAIAAEPLRESAFGALIRAHMAEGNRAEASHQFEVYRRLLADELGVAPSAQIRSLLLEDPSA